MANINGNSPESTILVQMRLQPKTMERINRLSEITGTTNRTQLVASSIELTEELMSNTKDGGKIYIERADGTKERIKIIGL
jgi:hypothetical protein